MNERSISAEQISVAKRLSSVRLRQRMQAEALPQSGSEDGMTLCTLNTAIALKTADTNVIQIIHGQARRVLIHAPNGYVYLVDVDANTCSCPVWCKSQDCEHVKAVREHLQH